MGSVLEFQLSLQCYINMFLKVPLVSQWFSRASSRRGGRAGDKRGRAALSGCGMGRGGGRYGATVRSGIWDRSRLSALYVRVACGSFGFPRCWVISIPRLARLRRARVVRFSSFQPTTARSAATIAASVIGSEIYSSSDASFSCGSGSAAASSSAASASWVSAFSGSWVS